MDWLEATVYAGGGNIDELCVLLEALGANGLIIEDEADFKNFLETNKEYWDYVDDALFSEKSGKSRVKFYFIDDAEGRRFLDNVKEELSVRGFPMSVMPVRDEDWENNWQKYYRPMEIGERLIVVPEWEEVPEHEGRAVLRLNPGLIFGTGSHPTTRMCLKEIEKHAPPGTDMLDLGCGSGILAIAALLLGCGRAIGCDIDPKAPETAQKNAALSGIGEDRFTVYCGDILKNRELRDVIGPRRYGIICANIVSDVIIRLAPDIPSLLAPDGKFICSGIIEGRQEEVREAIKNSGLRIIEARREEDWYCFTACLPCP